MHVSASPNALINSGNVTFGINVPNRLSGGHALPVREVPNKSWEFDRLSISDRHVREDL